MSLITIKFSPEMEDLVMRGEKCMTTRLSRKGEPGDIFIVRNRVYRLLTVLHTHNLEMLRYCYGDEGFNSFQEFKEYLISIYPDVEYGPIIIHTFACVGKIDCKNGFRSGDRCLIRSTCDVVKECEI